MLTGLLLGVVFLLCGAARANASSSLPSGFDESTVATLGLNSFPTDMAFAPDGRLFVTLKYGQVSVIKNGQLLPQPFVYLATNGANERGVLGVAIDPQFAQNNYVYIYYTFNTPVVHNRVSRFTASGDVAMPGSELVLVDLDPVTTTYHNSGAIRFGADGKLYVAVGNDNVNTNSQTLANRLGKILRINSDGSIPTDNPFYATAVGDNRAIWVYGLRNPFKIAIQPGTGRVFINDVGYETWEEINDGIGGSNYGWPTTEGMTTDPRFRSPLYAYGHGDGDLVGRCITGAAFYNPQSPTFPSSFIGKYFYEDYVNGWIHVFDPATGTSSSFAGGIPNLVDLELGPDGALYYLTIGGDQPSQGRGSIRKIQYTGQQAPWIGQQPASVTVPENTSATFEVRASGDAPLSYQWRRGGVDIAGATNSTYTVGPLATTDDGAQFQVGVSNASGSLTSASATLGVTPNQAPTATITTPVDGTTYAAGDVINFAGTGTDPEDGVLPASAYTWQVDFHHLTHIHPGTVPATSGITSGSFTVPILGETSAIVWFRIHLTVTDSKGAMSTTYRDVVPRTSTISLATTPAAAGLTLTLDGQPNTPPFSVLGVVGMVRTLGAPAPQTVNGVTYVFDSWSDGGAVSHDISTAPTDTTYTAAYHVAPALAASYNASVPTAWQPGQTTTYAITLTNTGAQTWNAFGANQVRLAIHFGTSSDWPGDGWVTDQRFNLPADIPPGASSSIIVSVTAPSMGGSFVLRHRMVKENIAWFDQILRTNVSVAALTSTPTPTLTPTSTPTVTPTPLVTATPTPTALASSPLAASYTSSPPATWQTGQTQSYVVTVTNTGSQTWNAHGLNAVHLGVEFGTSSDWAGDGWLTDQRFVLPGDVLPGASSTFSVAVTAPNTPGGPVLRHRMVKENVAWFNQIQKTSVVVAQPPLSASYNVTPPTTWQPGQTQVYTVSVTNAGAQTWNAFGTNQVRLAVNFGTSSDWPGDGWVTDQRFYLPADVPSGGSITLSVSVTAPLTSGSFVLRHRMVKENVAWFDQIRKTSVSVSAATPGATTTVTPTATPTRTATPPATATTTPTRTSTPTVGP